MDLKIKKLHPQARLPVYAHPGDAGLDLFALEAILLKAGARALVKTGIALDLPEGTEAQVRPRSGLALNYGITVLNSPGTIDQAFRGEIGVILINHSDQDFQVTSGMKIAQMVVQPVFRVRVVEVEELSTSVRGAGGFGSTGL
ncbi:dUTP diphosphatase [Anthocerotibacter panamensis]|uniref:dUTP diphosphatase n=1 Tax=Anthocerotibacter panamensis TaxID=2857077 RepID=UPI001C404841|nr:dUTP diphosphatase [Anthocerotibacter panamensis]